jgi:sigma-54 dependent transcriptional regulator, acetoin dehydrogenase operon transcriptional activator AcoR
MHTLAKSNVRSTQLQRTSAVEDGLNDALAAAQYACQQGRDAQALELLVEVRYRAIATGRQDLVAAAEVSLAEYCFTLDDDDRASGHLVAARKLLPVMNTATRTRWWIACSHLQHRSGPVLETNQVLPNVEALAEDERTRHLAALVSVEFAGLARQRGDLAAASRHATRAVELTTRPAREHALALLEQGEVFVAQQCWDQAATAFQRAIDELGELSLTRDEGRALSRYAVAVAPKIQSTPDKAPVVWLARAQAVLGEAATWRDLASTRSGFRAHGRRMQDHVLGGDLASRIDLLDEAVAQMRSTISIFVDRADRSLALALHSLPEEVEEDTRLNVRDARDAVLAVVDSASTESRLVSKLGRDLVEVLESALVERSRMRLLLGKLAELDRIDNVEELGAAAAQAMRNLLGADLVVIARKAGEQLEELGRAGPQQTPEAEGGWRAEIQACLRLPSIPVAEEVAPHGRTRPRGAVLAVPMRSSGTMGGIYADKLRRSGQFNEQDDQLARLLADYIALAFSRLGAVGAMHEALGELGTTLDTIRDGVLATDDQGGVTHVNSAAARMLQVNVQHLEGTRLGAHAALAPLAELLSQARAVEGALVRLPHGSFVVTARQIESEAPAHGMVVTLVELDRAQRIAHRVTAPRPRYRLEEVLGQSAAIRQALHTARQAAEVDASVLITGESGTGKEVFAQSIHTAGPRVDEPFVGVNCAAVPHDLLETELFGYERGAFTGAIKDGKLGKFEFAGEGTILLDEIGDMPLDMQAKLLRVLQERVVVRVGGSVERPVRARVLATTHQNLDEMVQAGRFRNDLLFRLRVLHIHLPPLAARGDDIVIVAQAFLRRFATRQGKALAGFDESVVKKLMRHTWPGNVRELCNLVEREVSLAPAGERQLEALRSPLRTKAKSERARVEEPTEGSEDTILPMHEVEKRTYMKALKLCEGNIAKAARALSVSKATFYAKLRAWGMHPNDMRKQAYLT